MDTELLKVKLYLTELQLAQDAVFKDKYGNTINRKRGDDGRLLPSTGSSLSDSVKNIAPDSQEQLANSFGKFYEKEKEKESRSLDIKEISVLFDKSFKKNLDMFVETKDNRDFVKNLFVSACSGLVDITKKIKKVVTEVISTIDKLDHDHFIAAIGERINEFYDNEIAPAIEQMEAGIILSALLLEGSILVLNYKNPRDDAPIDEILRNYIDNSKEILVRGIVGIKLLAMLKVVGDEYATTLDKQKQWRAKNITKIVDEYKKAQDKTSASSKITKIGNIDITDFPESLKRKYEKYYNKKFDIKIDADLRRMQEQRSKMLDKLSKVNSILEDIIVNNASPNYIDTGEKTKEAIKMIEEIREESSLLNQKIRRIESKLEV